MFEEMKSLSTPVPGADETAPVRILAATPTDTGDWKKEMPIPDPRNSACYNDTVNFAAMAFFRYGCSSRDLRDSLNVAVPASLASRSFASDPSP